MQPARALTITRTGGTVVLEGFWARTTEQLLDERRLVSDLTLGPSRSHHVASELLEQLDPSAEAGPDPIRGYGARPSAGGFADGIAAGIEAESLGDRATLAALRFAHRVCELADEEGIRDAVVLAPCFGSPWDRENVLFLRFLAQGLTAIGGSLRVGCAGPRPTPPPPGLVVEWPPAPDVLQDGRPQAGSPRGPQDAPGLAAYAWKCFADGSWDLAARLLDRAVASASAPQMRANFEAQAQGMRIAMQRFAAAAAGPEPTPLHGPRLQAFLLQSKGWALTMLNEPRRAEDYLASARSLAAAQGNGSRDYLYLLNISSLNRLKLGDADGAMAMEQEIRSVHERLPERDWPLEYVNSINIARLQRRRGELEAAERSYERAFATTLGARSAVDLVYTNLMFARLYATTGRDEEAAAAWIRATLHWLAADAPEALGPRATVAFLGRPVGDGEDLVEAVSAVLLEQLGDGAGPEASVIPFHRVVGPVRLEAVGAPGWGVLVAPGDAAAAVTSPSFDALRRFVGRLVGIAGTVVVDDRFGCEVPTTREELLEVCVKRGAGRLVFGGVAEDVPPELYDGLRVSLGPAVASVEGNVVTFKRYLAPLTLEPESARIVHALDGRPSVAELGSRGILRELEEARVVYAAADAPGSNAAR